MEVEELIFEGFTALVCFIVCTIQSLKFTLSTATTSTPSLEEKSFRVLSRLNAIPATFRVPIYLTIVKRRIK